MNKIISFFVMMTMLATGCAQFKPSPLMVKVPSFYDNKATQGYLTLVADPYFDQSKMKHFFNSNLLKKGFLAVHFIAFNEGSEGYDLSNAVMKLVKEDGTELAPLDPKEVSKKILKHTSLRMIGWGFAGLLIFTIPFSISAGIDSRRANEHIRKQIAEHTLKLNRVEAHEAVDGFYFFRLGRKSSEIKRALQRKYYFRVEHAVHVDTEREYDFNIALN